MNVYFDNAATTPISKKVLDKMIPNMEDGFGNPSSIHKRGREYENSIEKGKRKETGQSFKRWSVAKRSSRNLEKRG